MRVTRYGTLKLRDGSSNQKGVEYHALRESRGSLSGVDLLEGTFDA